MERLPRILGCKPLQRVTFSQFESLEQCVLKGLSAALILDAALPEQSPSRSSLVGIFHHKVLELSANCTRIDQFDECAESAIRNLTAEVQSWPHLRKLGNPSGWDEINRSIIIGRRLCQRIRRPSEGVRLGIEASLTSRDGLMQGRPDYFVIAGPRAEVREYKSVAIRDTNDRPVASYLDQVLFYAALLFDNYPISAVLARIESIRGDCVEVMLRLQDVTSIVDRVRGAVSKANQSTQNRSEFPSLATPSLQACAFCPLQVVCDPFKANDTIQATLSHQSICEGEVASIAPISSSSKVVALRDRFRSRMTEIVIPSAHADRLRIAQRILLQNLDARSNRLCWSPTSKVLSVD